MYKNYIFDLYGTLIDIRTDESSNLFWKKIVHLFMRYGAFYKPSRLKDRYNYYCNKFSKNVDEIDIIEVFNCLFLDKGISLSLVKLNEVAFMFRRHSRKYLKVYDGVLDLLNTLKENNKKVYLLSNAQESFTSYELSALNLDKYFDGIVLSSAIKYKKPNSMIFDYLFNKYNLSKQESIMIGNDKTCDIKASYDFGIDSLYIYSNISPINDKKIKSYAKYNIDVNEYYKIKELIVK